VAALPNGAPGPEVTIAKGFLARLGLIAPLVVLAAGLIAGVHGVETALFALALVGVNFALMGLAFKEGAKFGAAGLLAGAFVALVGCLVVLTAATLPVVRAHWMVLGVFAVVVVVGHLGAVLIEARRVSGRLGDGGVKPWRPLP